MAETDAEKVKIAEIFAAFYLDGGADGGTVDVYYSPSIRMLTLRGRGGAEMRFFVKEWREVLVALEVERRRQWWREWYERLLRWGL